MEYKTNWKLFFILLAACVVASLMVLPYATALSTVLADTLSPILILGAAVQALVIFSIVIYFGLRLASRAGFGAPILEGALKGEPQGSRLKSLLWISVGRGALAGILIIVLSLPFRQLSIDFLKAEVAVGAWKGFLASFYGGIAEEVVFRLFVLSLLVWLFSKITKAPDGRPAHGVIWFSIMVSAILFGLGHLGITGDLTAITPTVVVRAVLLNGVPGVIFGQLFWKKGLESAIIAHFSADIVIHVITPLIASMLI